MKKEICFTGSQSKIGSRLIKLLEKTHKILPIRLSKLNLDIDDSNIIKESISVIVREIEMEYLHHRSLIFCHRIRKAESNPSKSLILELNLLEEIIKKVGNYSKNLNVIIIGSCTGNYFDSKSTQAYHYVKDFQKTFLRYHSNLNPNYFINMIELSYFDKYFSHESDIKYKEDKEFFLKFNNQRKIPSYVQLAAAIDYLTNINLGITGQILSLDNGIVNIQNF